MGLLLFTATKHFALQRRNEIEYRLTRLNRKLMDLQRYASTIGQGTISMTDMMDVPASMFGRLQNFQVYSHNMSVMNAKNQSIWTMQNNPMMMMQMQQMNPAAQQQYQHWVEQNLYKHQREIMAKQEEKRCNYEEKEIMQEKAQLESQLKMVNAEYEAAKKGEEDAVKQMAPNYTGN